jgi:hypothetical protein
MATDGGGWTLVANQAPDAPLRSVTASDVSAGNFGSLTSSYRLGNARIQAFSPTVGWRMQSVSTAGALRDNVFFRPQCRIDWLRVVGLVGSDVIIANSSILTFTSAPDSAPDVYCNTAYTSSTFGTLISGRTTANGSYGIGQNNSGGYCSIRMSSAAWASSPLSNPEGAAYPCTMSEVSTHHVRLWVK